MPAPPNPAAVLSGVDSLTPRVVFFGPPFSGKSALIQMFVRTAAAGPGADTVVLSPATGPEAGLRRELVPYLVRVENPAVGAGGPFVVCDCDGKAAGDLLAHPNPLVRGAARGALADAVRSADALVLIVDAAAPPDVVDQTFRNFGRFLDGLEQGRTFCREVGGLPVFLTLTKCDALHRPGDSPTDWLARVEAREREVRARFEDYFGDDVAGLEPSPFLPFGSVDLHLAATSVAVPTGAAFEAYADDTGSFGIEALVADVLPAARAYRGRVLAARRRLRWTVTGSGVLLGAMLLGGLALAAVGGLTGGDPLAARVRALRAAEGPPAVRLSERNFAHNYHELRAVRDAAGFDRLPDDLKRFVADRLAEFDAYKDYRSKFLPPRLGPAEVRTWDQLRTLGAELTGDLSPPPPYAAEWRETEAVRLWEKWRADTALLRSAADRLSEWYRGLVRRGNQLLLTETPPDPGWRGRVTGLLRDGETPPARPDQPVESSPTVPVLRGRPLTYASVFAFDQVDQARRDWEDTRGRLAHLRDLTDAVGLTSGPGTPAAILELPEPAPDGAGSRELAAARLAALRVTFPAYPDGYPEWRLDNFPDPVRRVLQSRLSGIFDTGVRHVRRLVTAALGGSESVAEWKRVADGLLQEPALKEWGRLLGLIRGWTDPAAGDPVAELTAFLHRDRFDLDLKAVTVSLPDELLDPRGLPAGNLVVTHTPAGGGPVDYPFRQEGEPHRERPVTSYPFVPDGHPGRLVYRPGDGLTAVLPIRSGGQEYRLDWSAGRSVVYQIDRLAQPPRLERTGPLPASDPAPGVRLTVSPPGGLPAVPVTLPDLRPGR